MPTTTIPVGYNVITVTMSCELACEQSPFWVDCEVLRATVRSKFRGVDDRCDFCTYLRPGQSQAVPVRLIMTTGTNSDNWTQCCPTSMCEYLNLLWALEQAVGIKIAICTSMKDEKNHALLTRKWLLQFTISIEHRYMRYLKINVLSTSNGVRSAISDGVKICCSVTIDSVVLNQAVQIGQVATAPRWSMQRQFLPIGWNRRRDPRNEEISTINWWKTQNVWIIRHHEKRCFKKTKYRLE